MKELKKLATFVGCVAGIVTGLDKIKTVVQKWKTEYDTHQDVKESRRRLPPPPDDE